MFRYLPAINKGKIFTSGDGANSILSGIIHQIHVWIEEEKYRFHTEEIQRTYCYRYSESNVKRM